MAAPSGNQFWKARTKHGRDRLFEDSETLWEACCEYFEWVQNNPLYEDKLVTYQGAATHKPVAKMRAMTLDGLCLFLDITYETWRTWRNEGNDFSVVVARADQVIRDQKFAGAAAELLNPNIIARDLGLSDKSEHDHSSSDGSMTPQSEIDTSKLSDAALEELMRARRSEPE